MLCAPLDWQYALSRLKSRNLREINAHEKSFFEQFEKLHVREQIITRSIILTNLKLNLEV